MHTVYRASAIIARSRTASRVLRTLAAHLGRHQRPEEAQFVQLQALALVTGERAVLLPSAFRSQLPRLEARLRRLGTAVVDEPDCPLDATTGELVVGAGGLDVDEAVLSEADGQFPARRSVEHGAAPGRYPVVGWLTFADASTNGHGNGFPDTPAPAHQLARMAALVTNLDVVEPQPVLERLAGLRSRIAAPTLESADLDLVVDRVRACME